MYTYKIPYSKFASCMQGKICLVSSPYVFLHKQLNFLDKFFKEIPVRLDKVSQKTNSDYIRAKVKHEEVSFGRVRHPGG